MMMALTTILKTGATLAIAVGLAAAVACSTPAPTPTPTPAPPATPEPTATITAPTPAVIATPTDPDLVQEVTVGPQRMECVGVAPQMCLVVNDELFYEEIDGFDHQPGYAYRLRIEQYDRWPGQTEIPQDVGRYGYRLLEVLAQQRVAGR